MHGISLTTGLVMLTALYLIQRDSIESIFSQQSAQCARLLCDDIQFYVQDPDPCYSRACHDVRDEKRIFEPVVAENEQSMMPFMHLPSEWEALSIENRTKLSKILTWENLNRWDFNVWELNELSGGKPLLFLGWSLLASPYAEYAMAQSVVGENNDYYDGLSTPVPGYHFVDMFNIQVENLIAFIRSIEEDYFQDVTYHNSVHAADVVQTLHALLQMGAKNFVNDDIQIFSLLLAAAGHDVHHPGRNNLFQVNAHTEYATLYNESCLENMHVSSMIDRISGAKWRPEIDIISGLLPEQLSVVQNVLTSTILHTDMKYHFKLQSDIDRILMANPTTELFSTSYDEETFLAFLLHAADISNPAKPSPLNADWADLVLNEFFLQGDEEKALNLPVSPMCDRDTINREGSQIGFIENIIYPTFERLGEFSDGVQSDVLPIITENLKYWRAEQIRLN